MTFLLAVAFVGGAASALTPCVLPILPALLAVSGTGGRARVVGVVLGLEASFFVLGIALAGVLSSLGLPASIFQWVAAALLLLFAAAMVVPSVSRRFQGFVSRRTAPLAGARVRGEGFWGGVLAGAPLGLIWAPCAGPILAGITVAGASTSFDGRTVAIMAAYGLGMLGPLLVVGMGGRRASVFLRRKLGGGRRVEYGMAAVLVLTAAVVGFGWSNAINRFLAEKVSLTSTPTAALERRALEGGDAVAIEEGERVELSEQQLALTGYPESEGLVDYGPAPEIDGITDWFNSSPTTLDALRGKVVLVDFWTYSCINCIRTLPYLKQWYADYADDGFVILGIHSPEFAFEKEPANVAEAIRDFGIDYPVALDPDFATWDRFHNRYWPAKYLVDRDGVLRSIHYGEGAYERTEQQIRHLLSLPPSEGDDPEELSFAPRTPETYLGYSRADRFAGRTEEGYGLVPDEQAAYSAPSSGDLPVDWWSYGGTWTVRPEAAEAATDASLDLHFRAADVFIVAGPGSGSSGTVTIDTGRTVRTLTIDEHRLYTLRSGQRTEGVMHLRFSAGVQVYSFTFG